MSFINSHVLMSDAQHFSNQQQINPYYHNEAINLPKAQQEHDSIRLLLEQAGVIVTQVASPTSSQDGVYTANWALVKGKKAVLARLPNARASEEDFAEKVLSDLGIEVVRAPEGCKFSGQGDALACGEYLFCGSAYRSDEQAQEFAAEVLGYTRIQLQTVPVLDGDQKPLINSVTGWADSFFYDIDLALAVIKPSTATSRGLIAYCPEAFMPESRIKLASLENIDTIEVSKKEAVEAFACNLVSTGTTVVMSAQAPELANELRDKGLNVVSPDITELAKGGGYIRCTTLTIGN